MMTRLSRHGRRRDGSDHALADLDLEWLLAAFSGLAPSCALETLLDRVERRA